MVKLKHVGKFIVNLNVNFNILKQFNCALVRQIKYVVTPISSFNHVYHKTKDLHNNGL